MSTRPAVQRLAGLVAALALAGCASTPPLQRALRARDYDEVARLFDADSSLRTNEHALYFTALSRATPGSPTYDPARARGELDTLLARFPRTLYRVDALRLDTLLTRVSRLAADTLRLARGQALAGQRADSLGARLEDQHRTVLQLQADIKRTEAQLKDVQEELERLKAVDLRLARPRSSR
jgi:hypothetical protein